MVTSGDLSASLKGLFSLEDFFLKTLLSDFSCSREIQQGSP